MRLILCVDDRMGVCFAGRRQSRDARVCEDIVRELGEGELFVLPYSQALLEGLGARLRVSSDPIGEAKGIYGSAVFLEACEMPRELSDFDTVTLYRWGRSYPADRYFEADLSRYRLKSRVTFVGTSHEKITKETYVI